MLTMALIYGVLLLLVQAFTPDETYCLLETALLLITWQLSPGIMRYS